MHAARVMPADDSLAHAIRLLEEGGFADAAARLRGSEGAPPQQKAAAPRRPPKRSDVELSACVPPAASRGPAAAVAHRASARVKARHAQSTANARRDA